MFFPASVIRGSSAILTSLHSSNYQLTSYWNILVKRISSYFLSFKLPLLSDELPESQLALTNSHQFLQDKCLLPLWSANIARQ